MAGGARNTPVLLGAEFGERALAARLKDEPGLSPGERSGRLGTREPAEERVRVGRRGRVRVTEPAPRAARLPGEAEAHRRGNLHGRGRRHVVHHRHVLRVDGELLAVAARGDPGVRHGDRPDETRGRDAPGEVMDPGAPTGREEINSYEG